MRLGYNTNGFAHHRLEDAVQLLAELGYQSVALTLDYHALNPYDTAFGQQRDRIRHLLQQLRLQCVLETGARFLLDPRRKHQPTLLDPEATARQVRRDFLQKAMLLAADLGAEAVSFWSGTPCSSEPIPILMTRLVEECRRLAEEAERWQVRLAFEPEPGMLIATMADFATLHQAVAHPLFGLTMDVGHLFCQNEEPLADHIRQWRPWLWNVHIEDMRRGIHDHLMFGEGMMEFGSIRAALQEIGYGGGVHVELSRHSHDAVQAARRARDFLLAQGFTGASLPGSESVSCSAPSGHT
jgi:sugar phosphate isomerase/epimerase